MGLSQTLKIVGSGDLALVVGVTIIFDVCVVVVGVQLDAPDLVVGDASALLLSLLLSGDDNALMSWCSCQ